MKKLFSIIVLSLLALSAYAQGLGGIKGYILNRTDRSPIAGASLVLDLDGTTVATAKTDSEGKYYFEGLANGSYRIDVSADGFVGTSIFAIVEQGLVRDVMGVSLSESTVTEVDDDSYTEFDMNDSGYSDTPSILSGGNDPFNAVASYGFSSVRYRARGYASETQDVYMAGVRMNDALTGYGTYSLWSGINEATRSKDAVWGQQTTDVGLGGYNGLTNILGTASSVRKGWRFSALTNSALYRLRLMGTYASGPLDNGWSYAVNVSARIGGNDWIKGVYYRSFAYYAGAEKKFGDYAKISFATFATPGQRGAQNASTQEVYDLMGDNMYNSNWGYQNGKVRNSRVRKTFEPVTFVKFTATPTDKLEMNATLLWRTGFNGYTALDWFNAADPRPDYYRNLPSYYYMEDPSYSKDAQEKANLATEMWQSGEPTYTHLDWGRLYNINYASRDVYSATQARSKYVQEERHVDQNDFNLALQARWLINSMFTLNAGLNARVNYTRNYKKIADLLGGDYYVNIDNFAERDFSNTPYKMQQDLDYYVSHGSKPQILREGDIYGYNYLARVNMSNIWANGEFDWNGLHVNLGAELGYTHFWREGLYRKGLYAGYAEGSDSEPYMLNGEDIAARDSYGNIITSLGNSELEHTGRDGGLNNIAKFFTYRFKLGASYAIKGGHLVNANVGFYNDAPTFNKSFISARTRNTLIPNLTTAKTFSADVNYAWSANGYNLRATAYYSKIWDKTDVMSFYDDSQATFTNLAMWGISERHAGFEIGFGIPLVVEGLSLKGALAWGSHVYTSNPHMTQTVDNSAELIYENVEIPYWKESPSEFRKMADGSYEKDINGNYIVSKYQKHHVAGSPELAASLSINYRTKSYWFFTIEGQAFAGNYLSMSPVYRTQRAVNGPDGIVTPDEVINMASQEEFKPVGLMNVSVGKSWYLHYKYNFGFSLSANNILNNRNVRTGGYEQTRLIKSTTAYSRFDSKYFYMPGVNYMLNLYFKF